VTIINYLTKIRISLTSKLFVLCAVFFVFSGLAQADVISDFSSTYTINKDGTVFVQEIINYDFEGGQKRGIFRTLHNNHPQPATESFSKRLVEIEVKEVLQDGTAAEFEITNFNNQIEIKIGNPDIYLEGVHKYEISYLLKGALSFGADGGELYWNATGNDWLVPINSVKVTVTGEELGVLTGNIACYKGEFGVNTPCDAINSSSNETIFSTQNISPNEGLTFAQEINTFLVAQLIVEKPNIMWMMWALGALWLIGLTIWSWRFHQNNKTNRPIIAQYEPYDNFLPMYTGLLFDYRLDPHDITAGIVYLAEQGFLSIKKTEQKLLLIFTDYDYELMLKRPVAEVPTTFLKEVISLLFKEKASVQSTVLLSSLIKKQAENSKIVLALQAELKKDLEVQGFVETQYAKTAKNVFLSLYSGLALVSLIFALMGALDLSVIALAIILTITSGIIYIFANYNRRSKKGYEALNHLQGFKLFLTVTDKERFKFFNAPEKSPELFMKYLPYAIALKVEEDWAKVFKGITIPNPDWYCGSNVGAFSAAAFTSDMSTFSTNFSSSSGTSASSGAGSSGGGGGGGGGGSW
jgi:uncharacterized membrane protein